MLPPKEWIDAKDPDEVLDYQIGWAKRIGAGDQIESSTVSVLSGTAAIDSDTFNAGTGDVTVWLSGGQDGETCQIHCRVETESGRVFDQTVGLRIRTR